jgi:mRNA interferase RelE/StbE
VAASVPSYTVDVKPSARKELYLLDDSVLARVIRKLEALRVTPRPSGSKKLKGFRDQWRIRVGDWRIIYVVDDARALVSITRIAHRREVYE